jgi:hypothetical protein
MKNNKNKSMMNLKMIKFHKISNNKLIKINNNIKNSKND